MSILVKSDFSRKQADFKEPAVNLNNLKTGKRMFLGFGIIIAMLLVITAISWLEIVSIGRSMTNTINQSVMMNRVKDLGTLLDNLYLDMWRLVTATDTAEKKRINESIEQRRAEYAKSIVYLNETFETDDGKALIARLNDVILSSESLNMRIIDTALYSDGMDPEVLELFASQGSVVMNEMIDPALEAIIEWRFALIQVADAAAQATAAKALRFLGLGAALSVLISILFAVLITRSIVIPLKAVVGDTGLLAEGDFTRDIPPLFLKRKDELGDLGRAYDIMTKNIRSLLGSITQEAHNLKTNGLELSTNMTETASSMNQITATTSSIKVQTVSQSASVAETHATLEQIQKNLEQLDGLISKQAECVSQSSSSNEEMVANIRSVVGILQKNFVSMEELLKASETGKDGILEVSTFMANIEHDSDGLMETVDVIQGIASQTNLLAMNAAIEAAHAGTAGKGFAVVADEIRKLAESSATEAKKIAEVLTSLKTQISTASISSGKTRTQFEQILGLLRDVRNQEIVIKNAMEEQDAGSATVLGAMQEMNGITVRVKDRSKEMLTGSAEVLVEMNRLAGITEEMNRGMNEIAIGTDEVNDAVQNVNAITQSTTGSISRLSAEMEKFRV